MAEQNKQSLDAAVEETIEMAHKAIEQTRAEADLAQVIQQIAEEHGAPADE
jgi:hypothetical protein